ncbi:rna recognition motif-containing protein [Cystoisospora suis]|uniref:Rna recognition motif-containing protein n=1 Tax=Cystoisospora suis TaxID=483139 RepID=A0A2C6K0F2_9APIC|nr:rna recognition motif-containing protein [Cystoisospora suis]
MKRSLKLLKTVPSQSAGGSRERTVTRVLHTNTPTKQRKQPPGSGSAGHVNQKIQKVHESSVAPSSKEIIASEPRIPQESTAAAGPGSVHLAGKGLGLTNKTRGAANGADQGKADAPRFILFVGSLPLDTTPEQLKAFFKNKLQPRIIGVRMLTHKKTDKPKGCAFVEFDCREALKIALNYHHRELNGRKVNIELSAGGGGNSKKRREKIERKNAKLKQQRRKTFKATSKPRSEPGGQKSSIAAAGKPKRGNKDR